MTKRRCIPSALRFLLLMSSSATCCINDSKSSISLCLKYCTVPRDSLRPIRMGSQHASSHKTKSPFFTNAGIVDDTVAAPSEYEIASSVPINSAIASSIFKC